MASTATISVSPTVVNTGQYINVSLTLLSPSGDTTRQLQRVEPYVLNGQAPTAGPAANQPVVNIVIGGATVLSASTAAAPAPLTFNWVQQCFAPPAPANPTYPSTPVYDLFTIGAVAYFSDGSTASASTSVFVYPLQKDSTLVLSAMPGNGGLRHDANTESALLAAEQEAMLMAATSTLQSMIFFNLATSGRA